MSQPSLQPSPRGRGGFEGRTLVLKLGGSVGQEDTLPEDIAELQRLGARVVVVHGGGPLITTWLDRIGKETRFVKGLRYTDEETLQVVRMVLGGLVNGEVVARLAAAGVHAVGLSGTDDGLIRARVLDPELGLVGEVIAVNPRPVELLLEAGYVVAIAPVASTDEGGFLNINADTVAGEIALALRADWLLFLTDVPGISDGSQQISRLTPEEAHSLIASGIVNGGMIPKVEACIRALGRGSCAQIVDGRSPHVVLRALAEDQEVGTVLADSAVRR